VGSVSVSNALRELGIFDLGCVTYATEQGQQDTDIECRGECGGCEQEIDGMQLWQGGPCAETVAVCGGDVFVFGAVVEDEGVGEDANDGQGEEEGQNAQPGMCGGGDSASLQCLTGLRAPSTTSIALGVVAGAAAEEARRGLVHMAEWLHCSCASCEESIVGALLHGGIVVTTEHALMITE
jgi:hypothetical protein